MGLGGVWRGEKGEHENELARGVACFDSASQGERKKKKEKRNHERPLFYYVERRKYTN